MEKELKHISVQTLPNGYALTVGKQEYLVFDEQQLSAAVFHHITIGVEDYVNKDISENLMVAAASWPTVSDAIQGNATLMAHNKELTREARVTRSQLSALNLKYDALRADHTDLKKKYAKALIKAEEYEAEKKKAETAYNLYNKQCLHSYKLEKDIAELRKTLANRKNAAESKRKKRKREELSDDKPDKQKTTK